jgi:DHA2 family multidrug resistance protein-like MFS transporter
MVVVAGTTTGSSYGRVFLAMVLMGGGMGLAQAPATESIMGSLPREKAGVGSAVNDTTRELGGALGVAVIGSVLSSLYDDRLVERAGGSVPPPALDAAKESAGAAFGVADELGGQPGSALVDAAREAFVHGFTRASLVTAAFAVVGALVALRWLPARATGDEPALEDDDVPIDERQPELVN